MASGNFEEYLRWQQRLERYRACDLTVKEFCRQEGLGQRSFARWRNKLKDGIPQQLIAEQTQREQAEASLSLFLPVALSAEEQADMVQIDLPNGAQVRLSMGVSRRVLLEVVRVVAAADFGRASS
jgi:hypothetical protein